MKIIAKSVIIFFTLIFLVGCNSVLDNRSEAEIQMQKHLKEKNEAILKEFSESKKMQKLYTLFLERTKHVNMERESRINSIDSWDKANNMFSLYFFELYKYSKKDRTLFLNYVKIKGYSIHSISNNQIVIEKNEDIVKYYNSIKEPIDKYLFKSDVRIYW